MLFSFQKEIRQCAKVKRSKRSTALMMLAFFVVLIVVFVLFGCAESPAATGTAPLPAAPAPAPASIPPALPGEASAPAEGSAESPGIPDAAESVADGSGGNVLDDGQAADAVAINGYFDQMLAKGSVIGVPARDLFRRLPRYGMSFFRQPASTYAPLDAVPVTSGYILGPEDELYITLWGMMEGNFNVRVNRDGLANVPHIGSIRLAGYTLEETKRALRAAFDQSFTNYSMNVSMGELRSVTIYVTGDVRRPGAYTVSSFATLVNALLASGGPSPSGTLRRIELKRGGATITVFDMYDLLLKGDRTKDVRLQPEDVIFVPPVGPLVGLAGEVRRPGVYELNGTIRVWDLLDLAGGISQQTFQGRVQYFQIEDRRYRTVFEGDVHGLADKVAQDGDILRLFPVLDTPTTVRISGPVGRPGVYGVVPGTTRVSELISVAGGLLVTASNRAELTRVTPTRNGPLSVRYEIDLAAALQGDPANDLALQLNDYLQVHIVPEWELQRMVRVSGEVLYPGVYTVARGERLSDLIRRCGGFTARAGVRGAIFTRRSVAEEQRRELNRVADQLELDLMEAERDSVGVNTSPGVFMQEHRRRRDLVDRLRNVELEDGDALHIPQQPTTVEVMGAVYVSSSHIHSSHMSINDYINAAGGYLRLAHKRMLYLLKSDGTVIRLTRDTSAFSGKKWTPPQGYSAALEPGDTLVVPLKYSSGQSVESLQQAIDIIYKVAVAVGVIIK